MWPPPPKEPPDGPMEWPPPLEAPGLYDRGPDELLPAGMVWVAVTPLTP